MRAEAAQAGVSSPAYAGARTPSRAVPRTRLAQAVPWVATRGSIRGACGGREVVLRTVGNPASSFVEPRPEVAAVRPGQGLVPKRVCIFVEPSPFTYVCGYKNRFCNLIRYLREAGCEVLVITTGPGIVLEGDAGREQPTDYFGARVVSAYSFSCPLYWPLPLSFALSPRLWREVRDFKPDIVHCSSPGVMVIAAWLYATILRSPLVFSYHTHLPAYLPRYGLSVLVSAMWAVLRMFHTQAFLTLCTSEAMKKELQANNVSGERQIEVWKRGVDTDVFNPSFRRADMKRQLTQGHEEDPVMVYVGRLGAEKNIHFLEGVLDRVPRLRLALVGDGPSRGELEAVFRRFGDRVTFMGMMHGDELSAAYASADLFVMPSESETLGFVVLEAMASAVPVVAVGAGGIPDIVTRSGDDGVGYLYESGDLDGCCAAISRLIEDPALRERVGQAGRAEVSKWDWRAATTHLLTEQYPLAVATCQAYYGDKFRVPRLGAPTPDAGNGWADSASPAGALA